MRTSLAVRGIRELGRHCSPIRSPAKALTACAMFWFASAVFHLGVFIIDDRAWYGASSWRKPIVFSISISLLLWTFGWILDRLPDRTKLAWSLALVYSLASTVETLLIAVQTWRGRASHFNVQTSGDAAIFAAMGVVVGIMALLLVTLFVWTLVERLKQPLERMAVFGGMALVMSALGLGSWLVALGVAYLDKFGTYPETVISGAAGVAKFPHGIALHGIQVFVLAAFFLSRPEITATTANRMMRVVIASYSGILLFASLQSFGGRAPARPRYRRRGSSLQQLRSADFGSGYQLTVVAERKQQPGRFKHNQ